ELERGQVELREQVGALEVERGRKQRDTDLPRVTQELPIVVGAELECLAVLAVRATEAQLVVIGLVVELACVQRTIAALLQLDCVDPAVLGSVDEPLRLLDVALVVVADLGDHVAVEVVTDVDAVDDEVSRAPGGHAGHATRSRATSASTRASTSSV